MLLPLTAQGSKISTVVALDTSATKICTDPSLDVHYKFPVLKAQSGIARDRDFVRLSAAVVKEDNIERSQFQMLAEKYSNFAATQGVVRQLRVVLANWLMWTRQNDANLARMQSITSKSNPNFTQSKFLSLLKVNGRLIVVETLKVLAPLTSLFKGC
jgi:hypothetical protein